MAGDKMAGMPKRRRYGTGSLFKNGRTWWLRYYIRGQRVTENSKLEDRDEAEELLKQRVAEAAAGQLTAVLSRVTVADLCGLVLADNRLRKLRDTKTVEWRYEANVKPLLGKIQANRATSAQFRAYIEDRRRAGASDSTINRELSIVRRGFTLALREDPPLVRRAPYIPKLEEDNVRQGFIERAQYQKLLAELPARLKTLFVCAYHVGCRKNELRLLRWDQVDLEQGLIRIEARQAKGKRPRTLPIYGEMEFWLRSQFAGRPEGNQWVFYGERSRPIGDHLDGWTEACARAEMPGLLFHDLRRSAVRNMERAGIPRHVAMGISGHRTESTYRRYDIVSHSDIETAKAALEEFAQTGKKLSIIKMVEKPRKAVK